MNPEESKRSVSERINPQETERIDPEESERSLSELDQSLSDADQSASDVDQTLSESDQSIAARDQRSSDHDQQAADLDQASSDDPGTDGEVRSQHEHTRQMRADSTLARDETGRARSHSALAREQAARRRDQLAAARDLASAARDGLATTLDGEIERLERQQFTGRGSERNGTSKRLRAAHERRLVARLHAQTGAQRKAAADDRTSAARDRELAALDRLAYAKELASAEVDEVTGALRRRVGLAALQREMDRTGRTGEKLTVVFIDVDGLKHVNDDISHAAGDELLRKVVQCVSDEFRSYDLILRFGGDEFVCSLSGDGLDGISSRFERIARRLSESTPRATISTGVSERRPEDTVETLIDRADGAMIAARRNSTRTRVQT